MWEEEKYVQNGYHGCGFKILYDATTNEFDKSGIKEIYLIACNPNASNSSKRLYYLLTNVEFMDLRLFWDEKKEDLICDEDVAIQEFNIRYRWFDLNDNVGMSGLSIECTNGSKKIHNFRADWDTWNYGKWMPESRRWSGSEYFVCGAKVKYAPPGFGNQHDQSRVALLDLAICTW
jgi:hypothetical protein